MPFFLVFWHARLFSEIEEFIELSDYLVWLCSMFLMLTSLCHANYGVLVFANTTKLSSVVKNQGYLLQVSVFYSVIILPGVKPKLSNMHEQGKCVEERGGTIMFPAERVHMG